MWLGAATLGMVVLGLVSSERLRTWLAVRMRLVGDAQETTTAHDALWLTSEENRLERPHRVEGSQRTTPLTMCDVRLRELVMQICEQQKLRAGRYSQSRALTLPQRSASRERLPTAVKREPLPSRQSPPPPLPAADHPTSRR